MTLPISPPMQPQNILEQSTALMLDVRQLKKRYGLKPVLRRIDLALPYGQRMALLGANGAGKTTLLRILAGLSKADAGTVYVDGLESRYAQQEMRRHIGFVAHQSYLYEELTVIENLLFFGQLYAVSQARERALWLLQRVGMERRAQDRVSALSRGQIQRVAWARALLHCPRLLLLDEPDTGLDQDGLSLIESLQAEHSAQGGSILFTTHQLERALSLSDQIVIMAHGHIAYQRVTATLMLDELRQVYQGIYGSTIA